MKRNTRAGTNPKYRCSAFLLLFLCILSSTKLLWWLSEDLTTVKNPSMRGHNESSKPRRKPYTNVLLQGHFNDPTTLKHIIGWIDAWSLYFSNVLVVGPFSDDTLYELKRLGIPHRYGRPGAHDAGSPTTYANLMQTLIDHEDDPKIEGVMYVLDDALVNLTQFTNSINNGHDSFPTNAIISTFGDTFETAAYRFHPGEPGEPTGYTNDFTGEFYETPTTLIQSLPPWSWQGTCLPQQKAMLQFLPARTLEKDGSVSMAGHAPSDVLFVPTKYAALFAEAARPFIKQQVFWECAFPTIVQRILRGRANDELRRTSLCTTDYRIRGNMKMLQRCWKEQAPSSNQGFAVYHPFKMSKHGIDTYTNMLHQIQ
jgi:hypothetical protein